MDPDQITGLVAEIIPDNSCLIFCPSKKNCENVATMLRQILSKWESLLPHKSNMIVILWSYQKIPPAQSGRKEKANRSDREWHGQSDLSGAGQNNSSRHCLPSFRTHRRWTTPFGGCVPPEYSMRHLLYVDIGCWCEFAGETRHYSISVYWPRVYFAQQIQTSKTEL